MDNEIIEKVYKLASWGHGLGTVVLCVLGVLTLCLIHATLTGVFIGLLWIFGAL
jgi:hypothetical protein